MERTLHSVLAALELPPSSSQAQQLHQALARVADGPQGRRITWLAPAPAAELMRLLTCRFNLAAPEVLGRLLLRRPQLLRAGRVPGAAATLDALSAAGFDGAAAGRLLLRQPALLTRLPDELRAKLDYLSALGFSASDVLKLVSDGRNRGLLVARPGVLQTNMAFLVGLGISGADIRSMLLANGAWAATPVRQLAAKWNFFQQEMRGNQEDLVLCPQVLTKSIAHTLGPRTAFARKKRLRVLMPSYSRGLPLLKDPSLWQPHRMAPLEFWVDAPPARLCAVLGFDRGEFGRYRDTWAGTAGERWRRMAAAGGAGAGGGDADSGGGSVSVLGGGGPREVGPLVLSLGSLERMDKRAGGSKGPW